MPSPPTSERTTLQRFGIMAMNVIPGLGLLRLSRPIMGASLLALFLLLSVGPIALMSYTNFIPAAWLPWARTIASAMGYATVIVALLFTWQDSQYRTARTHWSNDGWILAALALMVALTVYLVHSTHFAKFGMLP